jgi:hypothetical protein
MIETGRPDAILSTAPCRTPMLANTEALVSIVNMNRAPVRSSGHPSRHKQNHGEGSADCQKSRAHGPATIHDGHIAKRDVLSHYSTHSFTFYSI